MAFKTAMDTALFLFEDLNCPRSLTASILLRNQEYEQLVSLEAIPTDYRTAKDFRDAHQASSFLSKFSDFKIEGIDREMRALEKFVEAEELCKDTNRRFRKLCVNPQSMDSASRTIFCLAGSKIARILGDLDLDTIAELFGWGPGSTSSTSGSFTSAYNKFQGPLDVTSNCLVMGQSCVNSIPAWASSAITGEVPSVACSVLLSTFNVVKGDEIVFVPKNAKIDRAIGIPPHMNSFVQKGFGRYMRKRLKRVAGIDLDDQTINQRLAKHGSLHGSLATIDLSMASDTVAKELVRFLLPDEWFAALSACRSPYATIRKTNQEFLLEKFSAMGNGYTFELESLIFYALVKATCTYYEYEGAVSVYGDDIICPSHSYEAVAKILNLCGFRVNQKKSFSSGPFRESCGKDFYLGHDVRPIFLKENVQNVESLYKLANSLRRYSQCGFNYRYCDVRFRDTWRSVVQRIPKSLRLTISEGFGDGGIIENFDAARPSLARNHKKFRTWEGFICKAITRVPRKRGMEKHAVGYTTMLSVIGSDQPLLGEYTLRKSTFPRVHNLLVREWYDLGPWE